MKKLLVLAISLAGFAGAKAQTQSDIEGTWLVAGEITASSAGSNTNSFQFNPQVGKQLDQHWALGLDLGIGTKKSTVKTSNYNLGIFGRYTWPISPIFCIYGQAAVGVNSTKTENVSDRTNKLYINAAPYIGINVKNNFLLYASFGGIGYNSTKVSGSSSSSNKFNFEFGQVYSMGVSKNFGGKKGK